METRNKNLQSYRIVWQILDGRPDTRFIVRTSEFKLANNSEWYISMKREQSHKNNREQYTFSLCRASKSSTKVLSCSFFLLNSHKCIKLTNESAYESRPYTFLKEDKTVVCAFDVATLFGYFESWLETTTDQLKYCTHEQISNENGSQVYGISCTGNFVNLQFKSENRKLQIHASGLNEDEILLIEWIGNGRYKTEKFEIGPGTSHYSNMLFVGEKLKVHCKLYPFQEMDRDRISQFKKIIHDASLVSAKIEENKRLNVSSSKPVLNASTDDKQLIQTITKPAAANPLNLTTVEPASVTQISSKPPAKLTTNQLIQTTAPPIVEMPSKPQAANTSTAQNLLSMAVQCFCDQKFSDITIQVENSDHAIRANKFVLASGSTVWHQLLTNDDQLSLINVTNFESDIIESLVAFIYTGSVPNPPKRTDQLLIAARTYGVYGLQIWCEQQLIRTVTIDTAIGLLVLGHRYNAKELFESAVTFVRQNLAQLKQRDEWKSVFFSYPELALELFNNMW